MVLSKGQGVHVWDVDGNRYLDCLSAYSAVNQVGARALVLLLPSVASEPSTTKTHSIDN